jgi:hypothetical protein
VTGKRGAKGQKAPSTGRDIAPPPEPVDGDGTRRQRLAFVAAAAFVAVTLPRLLAHELWRDEAWLWLVAIDSPSWDAMAETLARSGQGYLFPLLCYAAAQLTTAPIALQLLHLAVATASAFAFVRWAPFSPAVRLLFVCGYLPAYEYAVISRHYAAGSLLLWLACAAACRRNHVVALGAALCLLCQTTVYGLLLAGAVAATALLARAPAVVGASRRGLAGATALAAGGAVAGVVQLIPAPGTSFAPAWRTTWDGALATTVLGVPWRALVPLPWPRVQFWNSNVLDPWPVAQALAGIVAVVIGTALLLPGRSRTSTPGVPPWSRLAAPAVFLGGTLALLLFSYGKLIGAQRHHGHWLLLLVASLWLVQGLAPGPPDPRSWRHRALLAVLVANVVAAVFASAVDLVHPFTNGPATARLLQATGLDHLPLMGWREPPAAAVALPLGAPLWAPSRQVWARYPDWGPTQRELALPEVRCAARSLAAREASDVVVVASRELPAWEELELAGARLGAIAASEDYRLYRLHRAQLAATEAAAACPGLQ